MAEAFSQFQDEVPIIRDTPVASRAKGLEAIGQSLGNVSQGLMQTTARLEQEKSSALLLQATSSADQIKSDALLKLKTHPQLASKIAQDTQQQLDNIKNNTPVNAKTKGQLDYLLQSSFQHVSNQAQLTEYDTHQVKLQSQFYTEWPNVLKDLYASVSDDKVFQQKVDIAHQTVENALLGRIISPQQGGVLFKTLSHTLDSLHELHQLQQNSDARSSHLQIALASPFAQNIDKSNTPIAQDTRFLQMHYDNDLTLQGIKSDLVKSHAINPLAWMKLTPNHLNEVVLFSQGVQKAQGLFNNGENWQLLKQRYDQLSTKEGLLTQSEKGERAALQHLVNGFTSGDYAQIIQQTPQGQAIFKDYAQNYNGVDPKAAYNDYISRSVQLGHAMHIDNHFIQPIPNDLKMQAQSSFMQGADPDGLLQVLEHHDPQNKVYVAASLQKPLQQEVAYTVGELQGNTDPAFLRQLILANQTGQDFSAISIANAKNSNVSDKSLKNLVVAKLNETNSDIFNYIDQSGDPSRTLSIVNMATNYVKYQGLVHNDLALKNVYEYLQNFNDHFYKAYQVTSGADYSFNLNALNLTPGEAGRLAEHVRDEAYQALGFHITPINTPIRETPLEKAQDIAMDSAGLPTTQAFKEGWADMKNHISEFFNLDRNPITITNTPDGLIIATDAAGHVIYSQPFTDSLVAYAHKEQ
ncbi:hypothetical protein [Rickettsiella endosymbiont of Dermanyssus gallinae]|uniref:hypothetical protein n=1 Tax=Rickettsiella endosymbiont of Dermanyssus gallinae TaxID=2856608 RepID=UPI001C52A46F|nr:hypothetical protein [Rickettsiella endosymbiont of Dermanyssus gallinae]